VSRRLDLTSEAAQLLAKQVADIYAAGVAELVKVTAARISRGIREAPNATTRGQLTELVRLRGSAQRIVSRMQAAGPERAARLAQRAYEAGLLTGVATNRDSMVAVHQAAVLRFAAEATQALDPIGPACLRWTDDVYRAVTAETAHLALTGALTRTQAAARAMDRYAAMGVTGFTAADGSRYRVESYAELATRTAVAHAHLGGTIDRLQGQGRDLVVVSDSPEECPLCRPWEGKVLSLSGADPGRSSLAEAHAAGLFHPNCTHTVTAWIEGLTRLRQADANPSGYADRQRQRELERRVRESKRRINAAEAIGDPTVVGYNRRLLARRSDDLRRFIRTAGRKPSVSARRIQARH
jgi:hypothetical protein